MATVTPSKAMASLTPSKSAGSSTAISPGPSPMLSPASKDEATKNRIISHMNADHADSLTRYLEHFASLPSFAAREPRILSLTLTSITLASAGIFSPAATEIALEPPLKSLGEARLRFIEMDKTASKAMGREPETIKRFEGPQGASIGWWVFVAFAWVVNSRQANWAQGSLLDRTLLRGVPAFRAFGEKVQPLVLAIMLVLHVAEAIYMAWKLRTYTVPMGSEIWLKWVGSTLFEGFPVWKRFNGVIAEEKIRREKTMH